MQKQTKYLALGLMSGTSLDGVDLALCSFEYKYNRWSFSIVSAATLPYPVTIAESLKECISYTKSQLDRLDIVLGEFFADAIVSFLSDKDVEPDLIASHGHTVFHRPHEGVTLQIGNGKIIADKTGITVINDFRSMDISLNGQGAPLVPIGDRDLFFDFNPCLNLGGFANISYTDQANNIRLACDLSPCNMALNYLSEQLGQPYDSNGLLARGGDIDRELLSALNKLEYYSKSAPKSLGKEWYMEEFLPLMDASEANVFDILATTTEHIAIQIASYVCRIKLEDPLMIVTGGGAYNSFLLERISDYCDIKMFVPADDIVEYKEALIFAYLGILRLKNENNVLSSVTGASQDSSSGRIIKPNS